MAQKKTKDGVTVEFTFDHTKGEWIAIAMDGRAGRGITQDEALNNIPKK